MQKLFYIMGKSSSGKDTIYNELLLDTELCNLLIPLVMYTTRPRRKGERNGITYNFVNTDRYIEMKKQEIIIECREYNTTKGLWRYFTALDDQFKEKQSLIAVGVPLSYIPIKEYIKNNNINTEIIPIYIELDDGERLIRSIKREQRKDNPDYAEICRRYIESDQLDFSEEVLNSIGVHRFNNDRELEITVKDIKSFILKSLTEEES